MHMLHICIHAAVKGQFRMKVRVQWTPPKNTNTNNKPKEKLHLVPGTALQQATEQMTLRSSLAIGYCPPTSFKLLLFYLAQMILIITGMSAELKSQRMNHFINSVVWNFAFPCISSLLHGSPV